MPVIEVDALTRTYVARTGLRRGAKKDVEAVRGVSFEVERGEIFGLLGPNGAGKTTTVEIIEGYRSGDGGSVRVLGEDPATGGRARRSRRRRGRWRARCSRCARISRRWGAS